MRLARKITLLFELAIVVMVGLYAYFQISGESQALRADARSDLEASARISSLLLSKIEPSAARVLLQSSPQGTSSSLEYPVRWVDLDAAPGSSEGPAVAGAEIERLRPGTERFVESAGRMYVYRAFDDVYARRAAIEVSNSTTQLEHVVDRSIVETIMLAALIVVLGTIFSITIGTRMIAQPTRRLVEQFHRVADGDLAPIGGPHRKDEMGALAAALDVMIRRLSEARERVDREHAARLAAVEQLRHADRLNTVGTLATGMAHELGTPLNVISGYAKLIATGQEVGTGAIDSARIIGEQTQRVVDLVRQLLDFSRPGALKLAVADLRPSVGRAMEMVSVIASKAHVRLRYVEPDAPVVGEIDEGKLQQVVVNLAINAVQASSVGGEVEVALTRAPATPPGGKGPSNHIRLDVVDHGKGIAPEHRKRVFEPFFTTKAVGEGTGLGLAVSYGIVEEHHGWIEVTSEIGTGSRFSVFLPEKQEPAP